MSNTVLKKITDVLQEFYKQNPYVGLLKISIDEVKAGQVVLGMDIEKFHTNFYELSHGGALMSLADTAMGAACLSCNKKVVTLSFDMNFIKGAPLGTEIKATGRVIHNGSRTMVCETDMINEDGELLCKATGTFFVVGKLVEE
jgi:acyl-CoA thioesterase